MTELEEARALLEDALVCMHPGVVERIERYLSGAPAQTAEPCDACDGKGAGFMRMPCDAGWEPADCPACDGSGCQDPVQPPMPAEMRGWQERAESAEAALAAVRDIAASQDHPERKFNRIRDLLRAGGGQ